MDDALSMKHESDSSTRHTDIDSVEANSDERKPDLPRPHMSAFAWIVLVASILCATFLFALDNTVVAAVQPRILDDLGGIDKFSWISVGFNMGAASANLFWGKLYGQFEQKTLYLIAVVVFEVGSAVCGAAPNIDALIVGRVLCGLGGTGIYLGTMTLLSNMTTIQERPLYLSLFGVVWGVGVVLGPIIGGAFASNPHAGWRWSFYINICIAAIFAPVNLLMLPTHNPQPGRSIMKKIAQLDVVGTILSIGAFISGITAISFGGSVYAWSSATTIALFCTSGALFIIFAIQQYFMPADRRIFPAHLLRSWQNWVLFAQSASSITILFLPIYFIPLYFQFVHTDSPLDASVHLLPYICVAVLFILLNGALMGAFGYYMPWFLIGSALSIVGAALMRTISAQTDAGNVYGYSVILAAGAGAFVQAGIPVAQAKHSPDEVPSVLAFMSCAQLTGVTAGFAVSNAIFTNVATGHIATILPSASFRKVQTYIAGASATILESVSESARRSIISALATSIDMVYDVVLASACLCFVLALFMKPEKLFVAQ